MNDKAELMKEKIAILNDAAKAYYTENREIMSNMEYDKLYDELVSLEQETGIILSGSPTITVGYEVLDELPKEHHETRMLSLDKTKEVDALKDFLSGHLGFLAWKLDGLTVVLTYVGGKLEKAVTRGTGDIGEVITSNARVFKNLPHTIPFKGEIVVRGEAIIRYSDFEKINSEIDDVFAQYKNPRNLCSGSVRQLNSKITAERNVRFYAFSIVKAQGEAQSEAEKNQSRRVMSIGDADVEYLQISRKEQMEWLSAQGFEVVEYKMVDDNNVAEAVKWFAANVAKSDLPSDGLVLSFDDIQYGKSLGNTAKFPRDSIAFKWEDEIKETTLEKIEWSASRTGLINPIAVFAPVDLEGSTVSRASVHNISILKELKLGIGDVIRVYKANMIIPQIAENLTKGDNVIIPANCPVCNGKTYIKSASGVKPVDCKDSTNSVVNEETNKKSNSDVETLICINAKCPAKQIKLITHFVSRNAMNIEGFSKATIEKFVEEGLLKNYVDVFFIHEHGDRIMQMEGFGEKSFNNLVTSIEKAKDVKLSNFIYALGINDVGLSNAKSLCMRFENNIEAIVDEASKPIPSVFEDIQNIGIQKGKKLRAYFNRGAEELSQNELQSVYKYFNNDMNAVLKAAQYTPDDKPFANIEGFGKEIISNVRAYFTGEENLLLLRKVLPLLRIQKQAGANEKLFEGRTFVITGSLEHFDNREALVEVIENGGGKTASSVSPKTSYLINNDVASNSSKNKKAKELGVPIISEADFMAWLESGDENA